MSASYSISKANYMLRMNAKLNDMLKSL